VVRSAARIEHHPDTWTAEGVKGGLARFYHEIAGVGLMFPRADRPIAVKYLGHPVITLQPIEGLEFVEEAIAALGYSTELATHLFRECWAEGTGSEVDLCRAFGWETPIRGVRLTRCGANSCSTPPHYDSEGGSNRGTPQRGGSFDRAPRRRCCWLRGLLA
jgi:hypothetical protein